MPDDWKRLIWSTHAVDELTENLRDQKRKLLLTEFACEDYNALMVKTSTHYSVLEPSLESGHARLRPVKFIVTLGKDPIHQFTLKFWIICQNARFFHAVVGVVALKTETQLIRLHSALVCCGLFSQTLEPSKSCL